MSQAWSVALELVGMTSLYYIGRQRQLGWWLGILTQLVWVGYAITAGQWAFIVGSVVYGWLSFKGLVALRRTQHAPSGEEPCRDRKSRAPRGRPRNRRRDRRFGHG